MVLMVFEIYFENYGFMFLLVTYVIAQTILDTFFYLRRLKRLQKICQTDEDVEIPVIRENKGQKKFVQKSSKDLVVGDIILVEQNKIYSCNLLIVSGRCLVNQSALTGESMPVSKR